MKKLMMVLMLGLCFVTGCVEAPETEAPKTDLVQIPDELVLGQVGQSICSDSCAGLVGEVWQACIDVSCGGDAGPGPGGIDSGGGGGAGTGESCAGWGEQGCRSGCFCKGGYWRYGTNRAPGFCTYTMAQPNTCVAAAPPLPPPDGGGGGGGGGGGEPCHGSSCPVEQGEPTGPF